ncbi:LpxL/LpxP family Kdo(2)-lipid IV(A) lauroyl/palmitoleoyl acyltransferase [Vibrio parahaemolyticus]|nr:LpxL/LpxP family Kdo(2)-lipid IV(A) lauroyl/palmitoleoyl acyltransferase [Vibrio parahaemolyticus]
MDYRNTSKYPTPTFSLSYLHPKYLPTWLLIVSFFFFSLLPFSVQRFLGVVLARFYFAFLPKRKKVIEQNLELCFPGMSDSDRKSLVRKNIDNTGLALFSTANAWFWPEWRVRRNVQICRLDILRKLEGQGCGVILVATHSLSLELAARGFGIQMAASGVYRPNSNPLFDWVQYRGRSRSNRTLINRKDVAGMVSTLSNGGRLWYAPDQDYGPKRSVFAPLFAVDYAATTTGTDILMGVPDVKMVPFSVKRSGSKYYVEIMEPVDGYPTVGGVQSASFVNQHIERIILRAPDEYMWLHRRFKTRPEGSKSLYSL